VVALRTNQKFRKSLRSLNFVLNKSDAVNGEETKSQRIAEAEKIVRSVLQPVLGSNIGRVGTISCTLFEGKDGKKAAAAVAVKIALSLQNKGPLLNG
jgi:hypothetical protein